MLTIGLVLVFLATLAPGAALAQGSGQTHVVQLGENLFRIALRYNVSVSSLAAVNGIPNPTMVYVGQTLVIPASTSTNVPPGNAVPSQSSQPSASATRSDSTHVVAAGENLFRIALRYGLTTSQLAAANGLSDQSSIYVGQVLRIPGAGQSLSMSPAPSVSPLIGSYASGAKKIVISISQQHLWAYDSDQLVYSFVASTGLATSPTKPGTYQVLDKIPNAYASQWNLQMPDWLGIYYVGRIENGIHALPILSNGQRLWSGYLGRPVSFGCIVLDTQAAQRLYSWADVGTPVVIQP
jgi:LysM repeat protein